MNTAAEDPVITVNIDRASIYAAIVTVAFFSLAIYGLGRLLSGDALADIRNFMVGGLSIVAVPFFQVSRRLFVPSRQAMYAAHMVPLRSAVGAALICALLIFAINNILGFLIGVATSASHAALVGEGINVEENVFVKSLLTGFSSFVVLPTTLFACIVAGWLAFRTSLSSTAKFFLFAFIFFILLHVIDVYVSLHYNLHAMLGADAMSYALMRGLGAPFFYCVFLFVGYLLVSAYTYVGERLGI